MESYSLIFSPEAEAQLVGIYRWISERASPTVAERFTSTIIDHGVIAESVLWPTLRQRPLQFSDLQSGRAAVAKN